MPPAQCFGTDAAVSTGSPILIVPYMWIGDFVRCHTVVRLLRARFPDRPIDVLTTRMVAPLLDYMPDVRKGIVFDLPRKRLAWSQQRDLGRTLRTEHYGDALIMPRTWKAALAPFLAGIPRRTGFLGELRLGLLNDIRGGEKALPRMVDRCAALALSNGAAPPTDLPPPQLVVPREEVAAWRDRIGLAADNRPVAVLAPGAVGPSKRWPFFGALAANLARAGFAVWVVGGPGEAPLAAEIAGHAPETRDLTGPDLRNAILALSRGGGRGLERFRPPACRGGHGDARHRGFRPDQPVALGTAQSAGGRYRSRNRRTVPALPQTDLPAPAPSLHARHRPRAGRRRSADDV